MTNFCGDCKLMPSTRCTHVNGRRAATPTTPAEGCSYFSPAQPAPAEHCPRCAAVVRRVEDNRYCDACGNAWKGVWR